MTDTITTTNRNKQVPFGGGINQHMKIVDHGRQVQVDTGQPVDYMDIEDSDYESIEIRRVEGGKLAVTTETTDGERTVTTFDMEEEHYVGVSPDEESFESTDDDLKMALTVANYTVVPSDDDLTVEQ